MTLEQLASSVELSGRIIVRREDKYGRMLISDDRYGTFYIDKDLEPYADSEVLKIYSGSAYMSGSAIIIQID